jgi:hypothetical protein
MGTIASLLASSANGQTPTASAATYELSGYVLDAGRNPISRAELTIQQDRRAQRIVRTGDDGKFLIAEVSGGSATVVARRLGYKARTVVFDVGPTSPRSNLEIALEAAPSQLETIHVTSSDSWLNRFHQHRKENAFGQFFDREEIAKRGVRYSSDLFRTVAGASLRPSRRFGSAIRLRGCQPQVWVDGMPVQDAELDEVTRPSEIAGLEVYVSAPLVPAEYQDRRGRGCGAIVVWTRIN